MFYFLRKLSLSLFTSYCILCICRSIKVLQAQYQCYTSINSSIKPTKKMHYFFQPSLIDYFDFRVGYRLFSETKFPVLVLLIALLKKSLGFVEAANIGVINSLSVPSQPLFSTNNPVLNFLCIYPVLK